MRRSELAFHRPEALAATRPAEASGVARDAGRLLVSTADGHRHAHFRDLARFLWPGDLLVVNRSATLPASLPAEGVVGVFRLNLSTCYGAGLWLAEPRPSPAQPGPLPGLSAGQEICVAGVKAHFVAPYPGISRLWYVQFTDDILEVMRRDGQPIRYGYLDRAYGLDHYQTLFAKVPGSAEMPSAAYPFTERILGDLDRRGVQIATILLHTGVSSLEVEAETVEQHVLYPEPYQVPSETAREVNAALVEGRQVIAVGTTVVKALESAWDGWEVRASSGFTRLYVHSERGIHVVDGLLTGLHDPVTSHLAMLYAIAGKDLIRGAYAEAVRQSYRWHEFGDSHLILPRVGRKEEQKGPARPIIKGKNINAWMMNQEGGTEDGFSGTGSTQP